MSLLIHEFRPVGEGKSYAEIRSEIAFKEAEERGCVVVVPKANELFVDIDTKEQFDMFTRCLEVLRRTEKCTATWTESPSGEPHHFHMIVSLERDVKDPLERITLQACLGSDPMREMLSWQRYKCGDNVPTLFFEKKPT